jgi:glycosyltransferase involved in cell wall biosynthesis
MRILFLTNYYPPHELGGQGRSCQEVVRGLEDRGHECRVLTSMHGHDNRPAVDAGVHRRLFLEMDGRPFRHMLTFFTRRRRREAHNLRVLEEVVADFGPDVAFIWGMWNLPRSLAALAERLLPGRVAYRFAEYWPTLPSQHALYWQAPPRNRLTAIPKQILGRVALRQLAREDPPPVLQYPHVMCVSAGTRAVLLEAGLPIEHARVIHTGIDPDETGFEEFPGPKAPAPGLELLYAGRISSEKGVESLIEAMAALQAERASDPVNLRLAGTGSTAFIEALKQRVRSAGLDGRVRFLGQVPGEEMPALMRSAHILVVPSIWAEPFARVVLEGMAGGLVVVAARTGGTAEIIEHDRNGLLYPPGDAAALCAAIRRLAADPDDRDRLARAGRETVRSGFTRKAMLDRIEDFLFEAAGMAETAE